MQQWKPEATPGLWVGLALLLVTTTATGFFAVQLAMVLAHPPETWPINLELYGIYVSLAGFLLMTGFLIYRVAGRLTLSYEVDRNGVYVLWMGNRAVIPIEAIERIDIGIVRPKVPWRWLQGIGYYWGQGQSSEGKPLHLFSTRPPRKSLLIHTQEASYAISPVDRDGFVQHLEQRRRLGAVKPLSPTHQSGRILFYAFWNDRVVRGALLLAFLLNLVILGFLAARYPHLPDMVHMRFDAAGEVAEIRPRHQVLFLPLAAFGLMVLNVGVGLALYRRERTGAQALQVGSVLVQVLFGVAVFLIVF